jgi:hypothetical protein
MWKRAVVYAGAVSLLAGISPAAAATGGVSETTWRPSYRQVGAPMAGVAATGRTSAWAISFGWRRWVVHWNGHRWGHVTLPARFYAMSIAASARDNVWICGEDQARRFVSYVWGGSGWAEIAMPPPAGCDGLAVAGLRDTWVLGESLTSPRTQQTVWHWNGSGWTDHSVPVAVSPGGLSGSSRQRLYIAGKQPRTGRLVAYHWNGTAWQPMRVPHPVIAKVPAISARTARNIWVTAPRGGRRSLVLHWNGAQWKKIRVPWWAPAGASITTVGPNRAWLGSTGLWTGRTWLAGSPNPMSSNVAAIPGSASAWVAFADSNSKHQQLGRIDYNGTRP